MGTNDFVEVMHELVAFVRVAQAGSFSAAARELGLTPSAVSRRVSRLETALGVRLLQRSTRQLRLTEAGQEALDRGEAMIAAAQASLRVAESHTLGPRGLVRLSAPKALARQVLQPHLLSFLVRYPAVDVHLSVTDSPPDPLRDPFDLMIRMTDQPPPGLVARPLMAVRQRVIASPAYLAARGEPGAPADLVHHSCLSLGERERDNRWRFVRGAQTVDVVVQGRYLVNHSEMRLEAVEAGLGVGCVPDFVAREALAAGRVVALLPDWTLASDYQGMAHLMFLPSRHMTPKVRALIDHLVEAFGGAPAGAPAP